MLQLFRRVRKRLLGQSRLGNYLLYAFGEILLVVVGILLALQINNWNQARLDRQKEIAIIKALDDEMVLNQMYLERRLEYLTNIERMGKKLLKLSGPSPVDIPTDSLSKLLLPVIYQAPYSPKIAQYENIMNSDDNNLIRNDSLIKQLIDYGARLKALEQRQYENRAEIIQYLQENYSFLHLIQHQKLPVFDNLKNEDYSKNLFPVDPQNILSDRKFQSMVVTRFQANGYTIFLLGRALDEIKQIRSFIKQNYFEGKYLPN